MEGEAQAVETTTEESVSVEQPSMESQIAADKAKLFDSGEQADSAEKTPDETKEPAKAETKEKSVDGEKDGGKQEAPHGLSPEDLEWAQKAGLDPSAPDFIPKLAKSYREAQREMSRAQQEAKAKETIEKARNVEKPETQKELTPIKEFQQIYDWRVKEACNIFGASSLDELRNSDDPRAQQTYRYFKDNYSAWRQEAFEREQEYKGESEKKAREKADQERAFQRTIQEAKEKTTQNLAAIRKEYTDLDTHMKESGLNDFLTYLDKTHTLPSWYIMNNEPVAKFLSKAARAIHRVDNIEEEKKTWQQEYEKKIKRAKGAELPSSTGDSSPSPMASIQAGGKRSGVSLRD